MSTKEQTFDGRNSGPQAGLLAALREVWPPLTTVGKIPRVGPRQLGRLQKELGEGVPAGFRLTKSENVQAGA